MAIRLHKMVEDIKRALASAIRPYFVEMSASLVNGELREIPQCHLVFDRSRMENAQDKPIIGIIGERGSVASIDKCDLGYQRVTNHSRSIFVVVHNAVPIVSGSGSRTTPKALVDEVYGLLIEFFSTQRVRLAEHGIYHPSITDPQEVPDKQQAILEGMIRFETRVNYKVDPFT